MIPYSITKTLPGLVGERVFFSPKARIDFFSPEVKWDFFPSERPPWLESNSRRKNIRHLWRWGTWNDSWLLIRGQKSYRAKSSLPKRSFFDIPLQNHFETFRFSMMEANEAGSTTSKRENYVPKSSWCSIAMFRSIKAILISSGDHQWLRFNYRFNKIQIYNYQRLGIIYCYCAEI